MSLSVQRYKKDHVKTISQWAAAHEEIENFHLEKPLDEEKREAKFQEILNYFGQPPIDIPKDWVFIDLECWIQYLLWSNLVSKVEKDPDIDITFQEW